VDFSLGDCHSTRAIIKETFISALQPFCHSGEDGWFLVADFQIVDVPHNSELFSFDVFVGNPWVLRVDCKANGLQISDTMLVVEKSGFHDAIEGIE
jgi:hypothetical protein